MGKVIKSSSGSFPKGGGMSGRTQGGAMPQKPGTSAAQAGKSSGKFAKGGGKSSKLASETSRPAKPGRTSQ